MLDLPAQRNHITDAQRRVQLGDRLLDEEVVAAADLQAHTHVVAQVNELGHAAGETVDARLAGTVQAHPLGADRQGYRLARLADVDRQRLDLLAARQSDHAALAVATEKLPG